MCQSRLWSQRGTKVNGSHHGDNPLLRPTGFQFTTKRYATLQVMAPINVKTVHQTSLIHIESNLERLGLLSPTHDQRSQQQSKQITLQSVLINKSTFLKTTHRTKIRKIEITRSMMVEAFWAGEAGARASIQPSKPCASLKKPHESCPFAVPYGPRREKKNRSQTSAFPLESSRFAPLCSRTRVQPSPVSSTIELPSAFAESGAYSPDRALPGSPWQCSLPLACRHTSRRAPNWSSE